MTQLITKENSKTIKSFKIKAILEVNN